MIEELILVSLAATVTGVMYFASGRNARKDALNGDTSATIYHLFIAGNWAVATYWLVTYWITL